MRRITTIALMLLTSLQIIATPTPEVQILEEQLKAANPGLDTLLIKYYVKGEDGILKLNCVKKLNDLSPLADTSLHITHLDISNNATLSDLTSLKGLPLKKLQAHGNNITDLSPISEMKLEYLSLGSNKKLKNLNQISNLPLKELYIPRTNISDLTPLSKMPLNILWIIHTKVKSLKPLEACPIEHVAVSINEIPYFYQMNTTILKKLTIWGKNDYVSDLSWIKGLNIEDLDISPCVIIKSLSPLMECPNLKRLHIRKTDDDLKFLEEHPSLQIVTWFEDGRRVKHYLNKVKKNDL